MLKDNDRSLDDAMQTTRGIDDSVKAAIQQIKAAAERVQDEFDSLPDMITAGILDSEDENEGGAEGLQNDIQDIESSTRTIEEANILQATKAIHTEMKTTDDKVNKCKGMLGICSEFTEKSKGCV